jgi:hypothetical protein
MKILQKNKFNAMILNQINSTVKYITYHLSNSLIKIMKFQSKRMKVYKKISKRTEIYNIYKLKDNIYVKNLNNLIINVNIDL